MKKWLLLAILSHLAWGATQTIVTGTVQDATGHVATSGYVQFDLIPQNQTILYRVVGTGVIVPSSARCTINTSGSVVDSLILTNPCAVWGNDIILPANSLYRVSVAPKFQILQSTNNVLISGVSVDLSSLTLLNPQPLIGTQVNADPLVTMSLVPVINSVYSLGVSNKHYVSGYIDNLFVNSCTGAGCGGGGGGSSSVSVNGFTVSNPNFNDTVPSPQTNFLNAHFQTLGSAVSAEVPGGTSGSSFAFGNDARIVGAEQAVNKNQSPGYVGRDNVGNTSVPGVSSAQAFVGVGPFVAETSIPGSPLTPAGLAKAKIGVSNDGNWYTSYNGAAIVPLGLPASIPGHTYLGNNTGASGPTSPVQPKFADLSDQIVPLTQFPHGVGTFTFFCIGVAASSSTVLLVPGASTATTCNVSSANGEGIPMSSTGTLKNLFIKAHAAGFNASSGVVSVLVNGVASTLTCTIGTGSICNDATHTAAVNAGDLVLIQFTTQATETLAGVKATLEKY
jgi:hypothetical protein